MTNEEIRKAIDKYQVQHPLHFGTMIDVTAISSKEGSDIISQTIEQISKEVTEDTKLWCICEMAKMYMQGVKPVYPVRPKGKWVIDGHHYKCSRCGKTLAIMFSETDDDDLIGCPFCLADMRVKDELKEAENE